MSSLQQRTRVKHLVIVSLLRKEMQWKESRKGFQCRCLVPTLLTVFLWGTVLKPSSRVKTHMAFSLKRIRIELVVNRAVWSRTDGSLFPQTTVWRKLQHHFLFTENSRVKNKPLNALSFIKDEKFLRQWYFHFMEAHPEELQYSKLQQLIIIKVHTPRSQWELKLDISKRVHARENVSDSRNWYSFLILSVSEVSFSRPMTDASSDNIQHPIKNSTWGSHTKCDN